MPKFPKRAKTALESTRKLFKQDNPKNLDDSDTEESDKESIESGEFSHIPLRTEVPLLTNLSVRDTDHSKIFQLEAHTPTTLPVESTNNNNMDQIMNQLSQISAQLTELKHKQDEHDRQLNSMQHEPRHDEPGVVVENRSRIETLSRIPDPIKSLPTFDGNRKQLNTWIITAEKTLATFRPLVTDDVFQIYEQAVLNKLEGRAKDAICMACDVNGFEEAKEILITTLGDKFELSTYKAQLWKNRQGAEMSVHKYYQTTKLIVQNIKTLAKQDKTYASSWAAISKFIEEDALAAFISGLNGHYFGYAQAAKPETLEDAYAFLCKFNSREKMTVTNTKKSNIYDDKPAPSNKFKYQKPAKYEVPIKRENVEPMEVDPSLRSRLTLNKKLINNHELSESEEDSSSEEQEENEVNFHQVTLRKNQT